MAIRRRVGNLLELYNDIYQLKKDCTVNDLLYFIDWIFHVRIMLRNIFMSHTQTLSTLNTCVELEEHLVAI